MTQQSFESQGECADDNNKMKRKQLVFIILQLPQKGLLFSFFNVEFSRASMQWFHEYQTSCE